MKALLPFLFCLSSGAAGGRPVDWGTPPIHGRTSTRGDFPFKSLPTVPRPVLEGNQPREGVFLWFDSLAASLGLTIFEVLGANVLVPQEPRIKSRDGVIDRRFR